MVLVNYVCAFDLPSAIAEGNKKAISTLLPQDQDLVGTTCTDTGDTRAPGWPQAVEFPAYELQDECNPIGVGGGGTGGAPACGEVGALCESTAECCAGLLCALNACD